MSGPGRWWSAVWSAALTAAAGLDWLLHRRAIRRGQRDLVFEARNLPLRTDEAAARGLAKLQRQLADRTGPGA